MKIHTEPLDTREQLAERIRGAHTILHFFRGRPLDDEVLLAERPRSIVVAGPLGNTVDTDVARRAGIEVHDTPGLAADSVAEFTLTLLLMLAHRVPTALGNAVGWNPRAGHDLAGRVLGIVGWGRIGSRLARLARGIGMRVVVSSTSLDDTTARSAGVRSVSLDALLGEADAVSVHVRASPETHHLIDRRRLARLRPGALLVNTARASLIDMAELRRRVAEGAIGAVALDVFDIEPLPDDDPLRRDPRVLITPHMAWMSDDAVGRFLDAAITCGARGDTGMVRQIV